MKAALAYAAREWPVLPINTVDADGHCSCGSSTCRSPGKHPVGALVPRGLKDATVDPEAIKRWWREMPEANVAIVTGTRSGLLALDVDAGRGGVEELAHLEAAHGPLPATPRARTGGGGHHDLFAHPTDGTVVRNSASRLGQGLDLRGEGGYIVAPPSRHASGKRYSWGVSPANQAVAPAPSWLTPRLRNEESPPSGGSRSKGVKAAGSPVEGETLRRGGAMTPSRHLPGRCVGGG